MFIQKEVAANIPPKYVWNWKCIVSAQTRLPKNEKLKQKLYLYKISNIQEIDSMA